MKVMSQQSKKDRFIGGILIVLIISFALVSCENTEAVLIDFVVTAHNPTIDIDQTSNTIHVDFPDDVRSAQDLIADFILSEGAVAFVGSDIQLSGVTGNNYEEPFSFHVQSEDGKTSKIWTVNSSNNGYTNNWGMGGFISKDVSHNRAYPWYINQAETGTFSNVNCAPSSVVMSSHWAKENFSHSVEDARSMYHPTGGGWYTEDIDNCLDDFYIHHLIMELATSKEETSELIQAQLDKGNILMLCVDVHYLRLCENDSVRVDKYYETIQLGVGHCIVLKGYKIVDGHIFFEVYDPAGYNWKYNDGQSKGQDRYYRGDDIFTATFGRWNYAFVIAGPGNILKGTSNSMRASEIPNALIL
jgi:hypothetical protein